MGPSLMVGLVLLAVGVLVFSIGFAGTTSLVQIVVGSFMAIVGAFVILTAAEGRR